MAIKWVLLLLLLGVPATAQNLPPSERLYQAIRNNDLIALRALVGGQEANVRDAQGQTPLILAAAFGTAEAVRILLDAGADVKAANNAGATALHLATGDLVKTRLLLERGADVHARTDLGRTPLLVAASRQGASDVVALLLDRGASMNIADTTGVTPLIAAASVDDLVSAKLLLARGADATAVAQVGASATALMGAAVNGNLELTTLLVSRKVPLDAVSADRSGTVKNGLVAFGNVTATHMATASGNAEVLRVLLDAGAPVDPRDVRGMTPLMWSVGTDRPVPSVVRLLLERGADRTARSKVDETPIDWARKFNNPAILDVLQLPRARVEPVHDVGTASPAGTARHAVQRSLPLLRAASAGTFTNGGCVACHAQPIVAIAANAARLRGFDAEGAATESSQATASLQTIAQALLQGREAGGSPDTQLYVAMMMAALNTPPSRTTDALATYLIAKQRQRGNWRGIGATRAPIQDGDVSRTAMAIRTLSSFGIPARTAETNDAISRAATWLSQQDPRSTEDRTMQLLGLTWAKAHASATEVRARELLTTQRADGGWGQTPHLPSDAYATGQVLYALHEARVPGTEEALQRGTAFLLRTQRADGSWHVTNRAMKIQPYFESGFPYGHDQWVSQAATAWATIGLSVTAQGAAGQSQASAR